ncbi:hypothetical protein A2U01_0086926, partial [Trifolium medium]|nr:hypothetical protein [Trifolium medium]
RMSSAAEKLRQARAAKNKRDAGGAMGVPSSSLKSGTPSGQPSPAPSFDGDRTKRVRVEDPEDT